MPETFAVGAGRAEVTDDGAVAAVLHPSRGHSMLLADGAWHDPAHYWGKGFVVTSRGSHRFDAPAFTRWRQTGIDLLYRFGELELRVGRRFGDRWTETYELRNTGDAPVEIGSLGISTPWRDLYSSSRESLRSAVHAHVWTGGADSWVWAVPMDGSGPGLGLRMVEGELWAYSVESRDSVTSSNSRGHLYLHVTDHARAPHAMGGQAPLMLAPGESHRWTWQLEWFDTLADFRASWQPLIDAPGLAAEVGESLTLELAEGASGPSAVSSATAGIQYIEATDGKARARISVLFHEPLRDIVERRIRFVLDRQRPVELSDSRRFSFVPYDAQTGLRVLSGGWRDWSDARERIGTALLLQAARDRGWGDRVELDEALAGYQEFVLEHLVAVDGTVADDSLHESRVRLYNFPWFARFLLGQGDTAGAVRILDQYYALGGDHFLAFDLGPLLRELATLTDPDTAARLREHLARHARAFLDYGDDLPPHEVNYEQSMVAPLLELLIAAYQEAPGTIAPDELTRRLPWLTAFAADQPDVRLRHVPIRHWDGYWFGLLRLWGDVFPHYWSVLSAAVYLTWPEELLPSDQLRAAGEAILRANLVNFHADGSATCAFVYPSAVNNLPAHVADPLANDQDWALVYLLRLNPSFAGAGPNPSP
ncbi:conserved hypothetical protein [Kribbella flavida DSM 17836]|uniref:Uncharacterized protein n=1 Tax=Kribbella flavida (strain DSM 17836 / JCM 10339 / NBRC 14399) TaxID=479435 RepID=D2Q3B7_KRIFD|nr:hypothetical protein [Kribbella flavida]ADB34040.1 conserved hypothetical protein [Kribbella flavida DSM 17836]